MMLSPTMRQTISGISASSRELLRDQDARTAIPAGLGIMLLVWRFWKYIPLVNTLKGAALEAIKPILRILTSFVYVFKRRKLIENGPSKHGNSTACYDTQSESSAEREPPRLEAFLFGADGKDIPPQLKQLYSQRALPDHEMKQEEPPRLEAFLFGTEGRDIPVQLKELYSQRKVVDHAEDYSESKHNDEAEPARLEDYLFQTEINALSNGDDASLDSRQRRAEELRRASEELKELQKLAFVNNCDSSDESSEESDMSDSDEEWVE